MADLAIDYEEIKFVKEEIDKLILGLNKFNLEKEISISIKELDKFKGDLISTSRFDEKRYFEISKVIVNNLNKLKFNNELTKIILDLSRIDSSIREVYIELDQIEGLCNFIGENNYLASIYNDVIVHDLLYTYCYNKSIEILENGNLYDLLDFYKKNIGLNNEQNKSQTIVALVESIYKEGYIDLEDYKSLKDLVST